MMDVNNISSIFPGKQCCSNTLEARATLSQHSECLDFSPTCRGPEDDNAHSFHSVHAGVGNAFLPRGLPEGRPGAAGASNRALGLGLPHEDLPEG